jgi:hypothetical protein
MQDRPCRGLLGQGLMAQAKGMGVVQRGARRLGCAVWVLSRARLLNKRSHGQVPHSMCSRGGQLSERKYSMAQICAAATQTERPWCLLPNQREWPNAGAGRVFCGHLVEAQQRGVRTATLNQQV